MVNAEYLENGLTVNGKKGLYNINSERQVKEQTDVVCLIFDKDSEEKLNEELAKKGLFNGVRNIIEQITNIDSPQNKFEYGKDKALSLQVYKLSKDKKVEDIIPELKELLSMNSSDIEEFLKWQGTEPIEKMIKDAGLYQKYSDETAYRKFFSKLPLMNDLNNKENYDEWLKIYPETNKRIWKYRYISWKQRLELWLAANKKLHIAKLFKRLLIWQHNLRNN